MQDDTTNQDGEARQNDKAGQGITMYGSEAGRYNQAIRRGKTTRQGRVKHRKAGRGGKTVQ
jgi:hypothetical protein